jgi:hypothetical protein
VAAKESPRRVSSRPRSKKRSSFSRRACSSIASSAWRITTLPMGSGAGNEGPPPPPPSAS